MVALVAPVEMMPWPCSTPRLFAVPPPKLAYESAPDPPGDGPIIESVLASAVVLAPPVAVLFVETWTAKKYSSGMSVNCALLIVADIFLTPVTLPVALDDQL